MARRSGIYRIRNTVSGRVYVGSATDLAGRWRTHKCDLLHNRHHSGKLQRSFNKHGLAAFSFVVLEYVDELPKLVIHEQRWINKLGATNRNSGYNIAPTAGSLLGFKHSPESVERARRANLGKKLTTQAIAALRLVNTGRVKSPPELAKLRAANLGKTHTIAARLKMSIGHTGRKASAETRAKMAMAQTGRKATEQTRTKLRAWVRRPMSDETKEKLRQIVLNMSDATRAKMSAAQVGKKRTFSAEHCENISKAQRGRPKSAEHKEKLRQASLRHAQLSAGCASTQNP
jgi:group I intron endonuclease